ncbi:hypothetical protein GCM10027594_21420 [Hymenobacter agri]
MENPSSPLDTLRQLKEMLDAGAITPTEFDALKQRLVFNPSAAPGADSPSAAPASPATPAASNPVPPISPPEVPAEPVPHQPWTEPVYMPSADGLFLPDTSSDFPPPALLVEHDAADTHTFMPEEPDAEAVPVAPAGSNSSLGLVLAIGAVLVFLAVVAYLGFTRPTTDEHISSLSQTAADSANTTIETGPQVTPLPATTAAPETVRVAPTNPAPVIQPRPAAPATDSAAPATTTSATDSTANQ